MSMVLRKNLYNFSPRTRSVVITERRGEVIGDWQRDTLSRPDNKQMELWTEMENGVNHVKASGRKSHQDPATAENL